MNHLLTMLNYDKWANDRTIAYLEAAQQLDPKALSLFTHILGAQQIWMERIRGQEQVATTQVRTLDDCKELLQRNFDEYLEYISWLRPEELDRSLDYQDMKGNSWSNSLRDIFIHVCNHGTYHRGQIALLVRAEGDVPLATDYIVMAREDIAPLA